MQESIATAIALALLCTAAYAEVSALPQGPVVDTLILGTITEDSDPITSWLQYRPASPSEVLNPGGHARGDGRPDLASKPGTLGWPLAIWAWNTGADHDIAYAEWNGGAWGPIEFLTAGIEDELDPRLFVESDGTLHAAWWLDGPVDRVFLVTKPAGSIWGLPVEVVTGGRRPSVAVDGGTLRVAFERDDLHPFGSDRPEPDRNRLPVGQRRELQIESRLRFRYSRPRPAGDAPRLQRHRHAHSNGYNGHCGHHATMRSRLAASCRQPRHPTRLAMDPVTHFTLRLALRRATASQRRPTPALVRSSFRRVKGPRAFRCRESGAQDPIKRQRCCRDLDNHRIGCLRDLRT
jgi:hypothetical protein